MFFFRFDGDAASGAAKLDFLILFLICQSNGSLKVKISGKSFAVGKFFRKGNADHPIRGNGISADGITVFQRYLTGFFLCQRNTRGKLIVHLQLFLMDDSLRDRITDCDPNVIAFGKGIAGDPLTVLLPLYCNAGYIV